MSYVTMSDLVGVTFTDIIVDDDKHEIIFYTACGGYKMYHQQDCCEDVSLDDVVGDLADLIGTPILSARESTSDIEAEAALSLYDGEEYIMRKLATIGGPIAEPEDESVTWTFYLFGTIKGSVTLRWYGASNGYYSESVDLVKIELDDLVPVS
jgi:hypothetical protein